MPVFAYRARDHAGQSLQGTYEAPSIAASADHLRSRGLFVLDIGPAQAQAAREWTAWRAWIGHFAPGPRQLDVEQSLRQLALMERAGLPLLQALRTSAANSARRSMARVLDVIANRIEAGSTFADALREHPRQFPPIVVEIAHAGEQSGGLDAALDRGAEHLQRRRELRAMFLQALFYPTIVVALACAVAAYMVIAVVPVLEGFLRSSSRKLPWMTRALVDVSVFTRAHLLQIIVVALVVVVAAIAFDRYPPTRRRIDRALYRMPLIGRVRVLASTANFSRSLGVLVGNGIALVRALQLCEAIAGRPEAAEAIARARRRILAGDALAQGMVGSRAFAPILPKMIDVGEKSGTLENVLDQVAFHHENELRAWIRRASALIEPVLTIVIGALVGFIYISFFLAMFAAAGAA